MNVHKKDILGVLKDDNWVFFNNILYETCSSHFEHKRIDIVMAKVCLIGRAYSASIERRHIEEGHRINSDRFYERIVAPAVIASDIDQWLNGLSGFTEVSKQSLPYVLETHLRVMNLFRQISGMEKRSLVSKYLHFHLPELFYIYDSRAVKGMRRILPGFRIQNRLDGYDKEYSKFCQKSFYLQEAIKQKFGRKLTTRQLDRLLLNKSL